MTALIMLSWALLCSVYAVILFATATNPLQWIDATITAGISTTSFGFAFVLDALRKRDQQ